MRHDLERIQAGAVARRRGVHGGRLRLELDGRAGDRAALAAARCSRRAAHRAKCSRWRKACADSSSPMPINCRRSSASSWRCSRTIPATSRCRGSRAATIGSSRRSRNRRGLKITMQVGRQQDRAGRSTECACIVADGSKRGALVTGDYVVLTTPPAIARALEFTPAVPATLRRAWQALHAGPGDESARAVRQGLVAKAGPAARVGIESRHRRDVGDVGEPVRRA